MFNTLLDDPLFPAAALHACPLGFIDVGARGGVHPVVAPLAGVTAVMGFEPDAEECERIRAEQICSPWARFEIEPQAVAGEDGRRPFYVLERAVNSSLLKPNAAIVQRYRIPGFEIVRQVDMSTRSLDSVLFGDRAGQDYWGEFLKLDAQGAELDILQGAQRTLEQRTVAAIIETEFLPLYIGQPLFSDVEMFMREHGFEFFGFKDMSYRSARLRAGNERLVHADAVFFKRPVSERGLHVLFACAMLLGYYDLAIETTERMF
jgi:FkbM family methyltransferase